MDMIRMNLGRHLTIKVIKDKTFSDWDEPRKVGTKIWLQEDFIEKEDDDFGKIHYKISATDADKHWLEEDLGLRWKEAKLMTFEQSRLHYEIIDVNRICNDNYYTLKDI